MQYFSMDPFTKVIGMYLEGVNDGRDFMHIGMNIIKQKPIVILRPGHTKKGSIAAQSHTKSIAGDYKVFDAACKQAGIIKADTVYELYDFCKILSLCNTSKGNRCLIITSSGGSGILATDIAEQNNIDIVPLETETKYLLLYSLPSYCIIGNPLDLTGDTNAERYYETVKRMKSASNIDILLLIFGDPIPDASNFVNKMEVVIANVKRVLKEAWARVKK